jgi:hypothetical protein
VTFARNMQEYRERRQQEREANMRQLAIPSRSLHRGTYAGTTGPAVAKPEPYRDPVLLEMAKGRPCLLPTPCCDHRENTTVAAHSNLLAHGKGKSRKADDCYSVWSCFGSHVWLDQSKASKDLKDAKFMFAHAQQVLAWRLIAMDPNEPERFRKAAARALQQLNATDIYEGTT